LNRNKVGIYSVAGMDAYAQLRAPFDPDRSYPELAGPLQTQPGNFVFKEFREFLAMLGWDASRYGTAEWNPFGWMIQPGQTVLLKPNLVVSDHPQGDELVRYTDTDGPL